MCWINSSLDLSLWGWCGDKDTNNIVLSLFCDSDFAGCTQTARSTTGVFLALVGPHSFLPLSAISKRQTAVSHSTPEAELVAADHGVRVEGLPAVTLWNVLLKRDVSLVLCEDNESAARVIETGRNPTMRHILRTHKVDLAFLHERFAGGDLIMEVTPSHRQSADIFTKAFNAESWRNACALICISTLSAAYSAVSGPTVPSGLNPTHVAADRSDTKATQRAERARATTSCNLQQTLRRWNSLVSLLGSRSDDSSSKSAASRIPFMGSTLKMLRVAISSESQRKPT